MLSEHSGEETLYVPVTAYGFHFIGRKAWGANNY